MARPRSPLTNLVVTLPLEMPAHEVLARAKAKGIVGTSRAVWKVREKMRSKAQATPAPAPAGRVKPSKPAKGSTSKAPVSKADFVRSLPHLSPREVLEDAKAAGLRFDAQYVYNVRAEDKARSARDARAAARAAAASADARAVTPRAAPAVPRPIDSPESAEDLLRAVAAEIGFGRAIELLQEDRAKVRALLGR
jgi:hypothetical protein